jgi:hypothetical protein
MDPLIVILQDVVLPALVRRDEGIGKSSKIATKKFVKLTCNKDQLALSLKVPVHLGGLILELAQEYSRDLCMFMKKTDNSKKSF